MGSKQKQALRGRRTIFERRLESRLSFLSQKGVESPEIDKNTLVKKLRAHIKAINARLQVIASYEKRTEELAKMRAEKTAVPPKVEEIVREKKEKEVPPEEGKDKKKKKGKETKKADEGEGKVNE